MTNGRARNRELNGGAPPGWKMTAPETEIVVCDPEAERPTIFAVVSTWNDQDIIGATVRNCFLQGASRVFLLDNASDDSTVAVAEANGAETATIYRTDKYDDDLRVKLQNAIIRGQTAKAGLEDLWWFVLDSDEFPATFTGRAVADALRGLPPQIRCIGTNFIDLYPTGPESATQYTIGRHPAGCFEFGAWRYGGINRYCGRGHWKHAIIRHFAGQCDLFHCRGNHTVAIEPGQPNFVTEPDFELFMFHAPLRREADMRGRLQKLCGTGRSQWDDQVTGNNGAIKRFESLDHIYAGRWDQVEIPHSQMYGRNVRGIALYRWRRMVKGFDEGLISWGVDR
jgi:hypothetical protein